MLDHKRRWIYYYKHFLKPHPDDAPYTKMKDILGELHPRVLAGECVKLIENGTAAIRIRDMTFDETNNIAVILFQYSDTKVSDPAFVNLENGVLRIEPKLEGEGVAISAHMVVSLIPITPRGGTYLTLLEDVPGIGRTKIEPFLTSNFREIFDERFQTYDGSTKKYWPTSEMTGYLSESLRDGLEKGYLKGFELKKYIDVDDGLDEEGFVKVESYSAKLKVARKFSGDEAVSVINRVKIRARKTNFTEMLIKYERKEGKAKSVPISTAREDAGDAMFSKFEVVDVGESLPQCLSEIRAELASKMTMLLVAAR
ncbi:MAG: hypothetical protein KJ630_01370 [Proteobacteria bacterium]|nr:hypothetical protein [Pseudomonadota bacterium]